MSERIDYRAFYQRVHALVATRADGTLFARTEKNHLIIIAVRDGRIVSLACGPKHGMAAIPLIRQMESCDVRIETGAIPYHERELPSTSQVIALLEPGSQTTVSQPRPSPPRMARTAPQGEELARRLCALLTEFIGPVAPLVCEEKVSAAGRMEDPAAIDRLIQELAAEIQAPREAREFAARASRLLQGAAAPQPAPAPPPVSTPLKVDMAQVKESLCDLLTGYLGPVAPIICEEKVATMRDGGQRHEFESAIEEIALEIDDRGEAEQFVAEAWKRLRKLGA